MSNLFFNPDKWATLHAKDKTTEALKLAEEASEYLLEVCQDSGYVHGIELADKALAAIGKALAEPVKQEPIAWEATSAGVIKFVTDSRYKKFSQNIQQYYKPYRCSHCSEPVKQEPVEQEPVAWGWVMDGEVNDCIGPTEHARCEGEYQVPLYAAPVDAKAIRAEALEEAAKVCDARSHRSDDMGAILAAAIRGLK